MRKPLRLPPTPLKEDFVKFELPWRDLLSQADEPKDVRELRHRQIRREAFKFYRAVCVQLGNDETKKLFEGFWRRTEGRQRGPRSPSRDEALLAAYDAYVSQSEVITDREINITGISEDLYRNSKLEFGNSVSAIAKHLRRLLVRRARHQKLKEAQRRRAAASIDKLPITLLEEMSVGEDTNSES